MKETKDQKIERLEKIIGEQKAELTEVKKDRKRLNYAVKRLEKKREQLSLQSSKEDTAKIKELEKQTLSNQSEIDSLIRQNRKLKKENEDLTNALNEANRQLKDYLWEKDENNWRLLNFMSGFERDKWGQLFFDVDTLITRINPLNGNFPTSEQETAITNILKDTPQYEEIRKRIEPLKQRIKEEDYEATMLFYSECKKLMENYVNVFFEMNGAVII